MSTCISRHGEYGEHEPIVEGATLLAAYTCRRCYALDEDGLAAATVRLTQERDSLRAQVDAVSAIAFDPDTISALEHGWVEATPDFEGLSKDAMLGYAADALMDIRTALAPARQEKP